MNGRPITKGWLENFMLDASRAYLTQEYKSRMPAQKLFNPNLEGETE